MTGWKGTTVPNSGTVGKVYLNTNLSNDEIKKICSALTNWDENNYYYVYGVETTGETLVVIKQGESYGIAAMNISTGESTWLFVGAWGENIVNPVIINNKVLSEYNGIQIGTENNKLSSLFSITEFKMIPSSLSEWAKEIADAIREKNGINSPIPHINFAKEIRNIKDDLATTTRILKADYEQKEYSTVVSTVVPNSGQLERIYFNKELSSEEVLEMISWYNLDYFNAGSGYGGTYSYYYVVSDESENIRIQIEYHGGDYIISLYVSDYSETLWRNGVWNEEAEFDFFDLNIQLTNKTNNNRDVGLQNDLLQKMFSITPFGINLEGFCGNIANAIRSRKITTDPINAQNFEEEILSIEPNAKTTDEIFQPTKADIGSSGNVYMNINAYTPEELVQFIDDLVDNKGVTSSSYTIFKNEHYAIEFRTKNSLQSKRQIMILDIDQGRYIQTLFYSTGWNNSIDFTLPILSNITPITNVGEYNYLIENLFTIGENRYRIKVDLDIEPEDLQRIDTVEIVTKTENKVIYAENGIKIFEVDELPTPSLQETG